MKNIIKYTPLALLVLFIFACGEGDKVPGKYLSKDKMSSIMTDMSIADAYSNELQVQQNTTYSPNYDSVRQEKVKIYYKQILDLHKVTVHEFMDSYRYYESHPSRLKEVLEMVQNNISTRKQKLGNPIEENAPVRYRLKSIFPYADSVILVPRMDTMRPFVKRQQ
ncbi:DUF4296 domain-containing protein [Chitinophaga eiseniae]|uniref:DUF4296 domain-containing protein n=1 Tax=Chitinophaga eiseniae TaxID=634771 RepID=A0A847SWW4_9BACT|nr:DUF4296 domain-containing protein [Chitinophaga eiseniae]NLR82879.1 DUF4296 domain-containing protein [Chitinophaga eiseniae]